jgi:GIY-YIG catalytic domain
MFNQEEECLKLLELINKRPRIKVSRNKSWAKEIEINIPGIYIFFENKTPRYVGETIDVKERMEKFTGKSGHRGGYLKLKKALRSKEITFTYLAVNFGRKEFEEWYCNKYDLTLFNVIKKKIRK